jgi:hypothetical protein
MSNIAEKAKILAECEVSVITKLSIEIKYEINSKICFKQYLYLWKKNKNFIKKINNTNNK